jgi:hypothetical protein
VEKWVWRRMLDLIFEAEDAARAGATLRKAQRCGLEDAALTGGLAVELHLVLRGERPERRALADIDFVVDRFEDVPASMAEGFLVRHVHPRVGRGKTVLQMVDSAERVRVDFFRAYEGTMGRTGWVELEVGRLRLIGFEDLLARMTVLGLDLGRGVAVDSKFVRSMERLLAVADLGAMREAWLGQRREGHPMEFGRAVERVRELVGARGDLLVSTVYSRDVTRVCEWCEETADFRLCDAAVMVGLLWYC